MKKVTFSFQATPSKNWDPVKPPPFWKFSWRLKFDSHINYANVKWGQNLHALSKIIMLQKKAFRIMNFQSRDSHSSPLFWSNHILKLEDKILIENIFFINKSFNILLCPIFKSWLTFCSDVHNYQTVSSTADKIFKPS